MADVRWQGYSHQQLYDMVHSGSGASVVQPSEDFWKGIGQSLAEIDTDIYKGLAQLGGTWEGQAADSAHGGLTPLGQWAGHAQTGSNVMGLSAHIQGSSIAGTRNSMPNPVPVTAEKPNAAEQFLSDLFGIQTDYEKQEAAADAAEQEAYRVMQVYTDTSHNNSTTLGEFIPPPDVVMDVPPPASTRGQGVDVDVIPPGSPEDTGTGPGPRGNGPGTPPPVSPPPGTPGTPAPTPPSAPGPGGPGGSTSPSIPTPTPPGHGPSGPGGPIFAPPPAGGGGRLGVPAGRGQGGIGGRGTGVGERAAGRGGGLADGEGGRGGRGSPHGEGGSGRGGPGGRGGLGGLAANDAAAARATASGQAIGTRGSAGSVASSVTGAGGRREEDTEHKSPDYVVETVDIFGDDRRVAPPVIGEEPPAHYR